MRMHVRRHTPIRSHSIRILLESRIMGVVLVELCVWRGRVLSTAFGVGVEIAV